MLPKIQRYIESCTLCQKTKPKNTKHRPYYGRIPTEYVPCENLAVDLKKMPMGILKYEYLLIATCEKTNFVYAIPLQNRKTQTIADALLHRVFCLTGPPTKLSIDQDSALTSQVIKELLTSLECTMQVIKSVESWKFQSRTADSNYWEYDKQTFNAERGCMATIFCSKCIRNEYIRVNGITRFIAI